MIVGFDLGATSGYAYIMRRDYNSATYPISTTSHIGEKVVFGTFVNRGTLPSRFSSLRDKVIKLHSHVEPIDIVYYEHLDFIVNLKASQANAGYAGVIMATFSDKIVRKLEVSKIKRLFTGRGGATKHSMKRAAERFTKKEVSSLDAADAIGTLYAGLKTITTSERQVINTLLNNDSSSGNND